MVLVVMSLLLCSEVPVIQAQPPTLDVILNSPVTLPCRATGSPLPSITWQKEGISIQTKSRLCVCVDVCVLRV